MSQTNSILTEEELSLVNDCAARLRVIQGDAAGLEATKRREYLNEEVVHSLKGLSASRRKPCLEALMGRFPVAGQVARLTSAPAAAPVAPPPETPAQLVERLVFMAREIPEAQRAEFAEALAEAGLAVRKGGPAEVPVTRELLTRLGLAPGQPLPLERVVQLASLLVQAMADLDHLAISAVREMNPRSAVLNRPLNLRQATSQFLAGSLDDPEPHLRITNAMLAGMLAALLGGGMNFSKQFHDKFRPEAIDEVVVSEGRYGGPFKPSRKECCWEKYCNLFKDIATADQLERWLKDCLGKFAEAKIKIR
jgi:hypothetical protein